MNNIEASVNVIFMLSNMKVTETHTVSLGNRNGFLHNFDLLSV